MSSSNLTRDEIVQIALGQVGNPDVSTTTTQTWLNNIVDRLCQDYKWPFLEKTTSPAAITSGQSVLTLPSDFGDVWDRDSFVLIDAYSNRRTLQIISPDDYDLLTDPALDGTPDRVKFDLRAKTATIYPVPSVSTYSWTLRYRRQPARITSNTTIEFPNDELLIQAMFVKALQFEDDERYGQELGVLQSLIANYFRGYNKSPIKTARVRLNARTFRNPINWR